MVPYWAFMDIGQAQVIPGPGHPPHTIGEDNQKLLKRGPQFNLLIHCYRSMIPEGLLNYLALLG